MHIPVLLQEVVHYLEPKPGEHFIDGTFGAGGHTRALLQQTAPTGTITAFDQDPTVIIDQDLAERLTLVRANFRTVGKLLQKKEKLFSGILLDLGVSSMQLADEEGRGFSFQRDAFLDMRMSAREAGEVEHIRKNYSTLQQLQEELGNELTAYHLVNNLAWEPLTQMLREFGEETKAPALANAIIDARKQSPIRTTTELASIVERIVPRTGMTHPATQVFQALRIIVNDELGALTEALESCIAFMPSKARIAVISFHSLEDRIVKDIFRREATECICENKKMPCTCNHQITVKIVTKKPVTATEQEEKENPRSRSAKLRVAEIL